MYTIIKAPLIRGADLSVLKDYAVQQFLLANNTRIIVLRSTVAIDPIFTLLHSSYKIYYVALFLGRFFFP